MKQHLSHNNNRGLKRVIKELANSGESMWPVDSLVVGAGNSMVNQPYNVGITQNTQPRPKKKPKKVKKEAGSYATTAVDTFQSNSVLNPGPGPNASGKAQNKKKKSKPQAPRVPIYPFTRGLKKVVNVLKDGAEGGFDGTLTIQAVGAAPESPTSSLNPGNVGNKYLPVKPSPKRTPGMAKPSGKKNRKVKKMSINRVVHLLKGGPGSGPHSQGGGKPNAKEKRSGMAEASAALSRHGYEVKSGGYVHSSGTVAVPTNTGTKLHYPSGASEHVPYGKLGAALDKIHGGKK